MPRKARVRSESGVYHVILRSVNQQLIFQEDVDYQKCLFLLKETKEKYDIGIYAYCLMGNHIHLLISSPNYNISAFMQSFGSKFVRWYNIKYSRSGHLFQERYHSKVVEKSDYYINTLIYIHNNPVAANLCQYPSEYRWSSCRAYLGTDDPIVTPEYSYNIAGSKNALLNRFSHGPSPDELNECDYEVNFDNLMHQMTDEQAKEKFHELTNIATIFEVQKLSRHQRNEIIILLIDNHFSQRQISFLLGISMPTISRTVKAYKECDSKPPSPYITLDKQ